MIDAWQSPMLRTASALLPLVAASVLLARPAHACSPPQPGLFGTVPSDGTSYPANAHILFEGYGISLDDVVVTVDGAPASLVEAAPDSPLAGASARVARVEPEPIPGAAVVITGTFCDMGDGMCDEQVIAFTATEPDVDAPTVEPTFAVSYDVFDHQQLDPGVGSCQTSSGVHYYIHVDGEVSGVTPDGSLPEGTSPEFWVVTGTSKSAAEPAFERIVAVATPTLDLVVELDDEAVVDAPELCIDVALVDAAGNVLGEVASSCAACLFRDDDDGGIRTTFIEEPSWTTADVYPGGSCPATFEPPPAVDDDTTVESGCACTAAGGRSAGAGWLLPLAGVALAIARPRSSNRRPAPGRGGEDDELD